MKHFVILAAAATSLGCDRSGVSQAEPVTEHRDTPVHDTLLMVEADTEAGFHFPYYLYIPEGTVSGPQHLLVETNNTGTNDTLAYHVRAAAEQATNASPGNSLSWSLKVPFLMPAFPRPPTVWQYYTHAPYRVQWFPALLTSTSSKPASTAYTTNSAMARSSGPSGTKVRC